MLNHRRRSDAQGVEQFRQRHASQPRQLGELFEASRVQPFDAIGQGDERLLLFVAERRGPALGDE